MDNKTHAFAERIVQELEHIKHSLDDFLRAIRGKDKKTPKQEAKSNKESDSAQGEALGVGHIYPSPTDPKDTEQTESGPWYKSWNLGWKRVVEIVGAVGLDVYCFFTVLQWKLLRDNFRSEQRAWITVEPVDPQNTIRLQIGQPIQFPIIFGNSGKSPAFRVDLKARLITLGPEDELSFFYEAPRVNAQSGIMFPNQIHPKIVPQVMKDGPNPNSPQVVALDSETYSNIASGKLIIVMYGEITYDDEFNRPHWAHFCQTAPQVMVGFPTIAILKCLAYNAVDDEN